MQLDKPRNIYSDLAIAASAALAPVANAEEADTPWKYDLSLFTFTEIDRVSGIEFFYSSFKDFAPDDVLRYKISVDVLVGASFNGAAPTDEDQVFARPSGKSKVTIDAGESAFDNIFQDNRLDIGFSRGLPISDVWHTTFGGGISYEYDYEALDANISIGRYLNQKNTTLNLGYSTEFARVDPEGGVPFPHTSPGLPGNLPDRQAYHDYKAVHDVLFGLTQVISRRMITQWNVGFAYAEGYLNDPYKIISVIDPADNGRTIGHQYEDRPNYKRRYVGYQEARYHFDSGIMGLSYRYTTDSWGLQSNTFSSSYRWLRSGGRYWELNMRYYHQDGVDFYRHSILDGEMPDYVTSDLRQAEFSALTLGIKYGVKTPSEAGWSVRFEYYTQRGDARPDDAVGVQRNYDMFPQLDSFKLHFLKHIR